METLDRKTDPTKLWRTIKAIHGKPTPKTENETITFDDYQVSSPSMLTTLKLGRHTYSRDTSLVSREFKRKSLTCCCCLPTPLTLASGGGGWSPIFPLVVHHPASPYTWSAVQLLWRGLLKIQGCQCGAYVGAAEEMMGIVYVSVTKGE